HAPRNRAGAPRATRHHSRPRASACARSSYRATSPWIVTNPGRRRLRCRAHAAVDPAGGRPPPRTARNRARDVEMTGARPSRRQRARYAHPWRNAMQYLLMIYSDENQWGTLSKAQQEQGLAAYMAYTEALRKA